MLGAGIKTQADIEVRLHLNKTQAWNQMKASVKELKASLNDLAKTVGIENGVKNYAALERELKKVQRELASTKKKLQEQEQAQEDSNKTMQAAFTIAKEVTYRYDNAGNVISAFAANVDEADHELRGLKMAMDILGTETKEEIQLGKQYADIIEALQTESKNAARATKLHSQEEAHIIAYKRMEAERTRDLEKAERKATKERRDAERAAAKQARQEARLTAEKERAAKAAKRAAEADAFSKQKAKESSDALNTLIGRINAYEKRMDAVFRASFRLKMAGSDMLFFARRVLGSIKNMMDQYGEFEFMLNRAAGALQVQDNMMDGLMSTTLDLTAAMKLFPAKDVAEAMYYWGSTTGQVVNEQKDLTATMKALSPIMKTAAMTNTGYEATVKGVYSILAQYYNGAIGMATEVTEQLFYVTQRTAAEFPDLINAFKMVGPIAKANNVSFKDMVNLFGRLADLGVRGSMAGRAFRQMFIQMLRPSGPAIKAIDRLFDEASKSVKEFQGKSYFELMFPEGQFIGTEGYLKNLALAVRTLTSAERNSFLAKIATANELPVLTALVNDQIRALDKNTKSIDKNVTSAQAAHDFFEQNWKKLSASWKGVTGALSATFEALKMQFASIMAEVLTPFVNKATEMVAAIRKWANDPANKALIEFLGKVAIFGGALVGIGGAVVTLTGTLVGLGGAFIVLAGAFSRFIAPIAGGITAIVTLADAFIRNFNSIKASVEYAADTITSSLNAAGVSMTDLMDIVNSITGPISGLMDVVVQVINKAIRSFADLVATLSEMKALVPILKGIATVMAAMFAARAVTLMISMTKALASMSLGMVGIKKSSDVAAKSIFGLRAAIGPGGIATILLGAGFIAYENNILGFADGINKITDSFRDLKKEVDEASSMFSNNAADVRDVAAAYTEQYKALKKVEEFQPGSNAYDSGYRYGVTFADDSYTPYTDLADAMKDAERIAEDKSLDVLAAWKQNVADINTEIAKYTTNISYSTQDYGTLIDRLFPFFKEAGLGGKAALEGTVADILTGQALGGITTESMKKIYDELAQKYYQIAQMGFDGFIRAIGENKTAVQAKADQVAAARAAIYQPAVDMLSKVITDSGDPAVIEKFLVQPLTMRRLGMDIITEDSLASVMGTLNDEQKSVIEAALQIIGKDLGDLDGLDAQYDNILESQWRPVSDAIANAVDEGMQSVMLDSMSIIGDRMKTISRRLSTSGIEGAASGISRMFMDVIADVVGQKLQLPTFMKESMMQLADFLRDKDAINATDYAAVEKALGETTDEVGDTVADIVEKKWSEMVDNFTSTVDLGNGLKEAVKAAIKRGSDISQARGVISDLAGKWLKKGLTGNLQSRQAARAFIDSSSQGLIDGLEAEGPKARKKVAAAIVNSYFANEKDMPKSVKNAMQPVLDWILNNTKAPNASWYKKLKNRMFPQSKIDSLLPSNVRLNPFQTSGQKTTLTPKIDINPPDQEAVNEEVKASVQQPIQTSVNTIKIDASPAGKSAIDSFGTGFTSQKQTIIDTYITPSIGSIISSMKTEDLLTDSKSAGADVGKAFANGIITSVRENTGPEGRFTSTANLALSALKNVAWYTGGEKSGKSWADGLNKAIIASVDKSLTFTASVLIGESPPKAGPLRHIDKGGFNIGTAWGKKLAHGASGELDAGLRDMKSRMNRQGFVDGSMSMSSTVSRKSSIDINLKIDGAGTNNRETNEAIRRGVYDSLVDSAVLEHMVTIR